MAMVVQGYGTEWQRFLVVDQVDYYFALGLGARVGVAMCLAR